MRKMAYVGVIDGRVVSVGVRKGVAVTVGEEVWLGTGLGVLVGAVVAVGGGVLVGRSVLGKDCVGVYAVADVLTTPGRASLVDLHAAVVSASSSAR